MEQLNLRPVPACHNDVRQLAAVDALNASDPSFYDSVITESTKVWHERLPKHSGEHKDILVVHLPNAVRLLGYLDLKTTMQDEVSELWQPAPVLHPKYVEWGIAEMLLTSAGLYAPAPIQADQSLERSA